MREAFRHWLAVPVRWGDMDAFGHVNNAVYFTYCESARVSYFDEIGLWSLAGLPERGPAIASAACNYRRQVRHPAVLDVGTRVSELRSRSFEMQYALFEQGSDDLVADGSSVVVWVDYGAGKAIPIPGPLRAAIEAFEEREWTSKQS